MLALSRKKGDSIIINDNIEVVVLSIQGEQVKIGVLAPKDIPIHRKEIYEQIMKANKEAATKPASVNLSDVQKKFILGDF